MASDCMSDKESQRATSGTRQASQSPRMPRTPRASQSTGRARCTKSIRSKRYEGERYKNTKEKDANKSTGTLGDAGIRGKTRNISLTNPHKVPRRHHEVEQPTALEVHNVLHTTQSKAKGSAAAGSLLFSRLRSSRRLQVALTCLVSATVLLGVLGIVNFCANFTESSLSSQEVVTNDSSAQNVMAKKLSGIAQEIATISQTVNTIQAKGYHVGFTTQSLQGGATLGIEENRLFYSASSIKGPYILAALENRGSIPASQEGNIEAAIVDSDNDAYFRLVQSFGIEPINAELASVGSSDRLNSSDYFVHITPCQLCSLWKISASYLDSGTDDTTWLQTLFAQTINSEIAQITGATTSSKAGWIVDEDESYNATVDAGIVSRDNLNYAMAIMCDKGEDFDMIAPLVKSLDALQQYFS